MRARGARRFLAGLGQSLVRDAARVHDGDLRAVVALAVPVGEQLADEVAAHEPRGPGDGDEHEVSPKCERG